jgi:hypothetical protein
MLEKGDVRERKCEMKEILEKGDVRERTYETYERKEM